MPRKRTVGGVSHPTTTTTSKVEHWTDGRMRSFITSALRSAFRKFPNKFAALKNAFVGKRKNKRTGREASHYECASCGKFFPATEVDVDHIEPVVNPADGFVSWDVYIDRLYCSVTNLQILCKTCHKKKTASERGKQCLTTVTTVEKEISKPTKKPTTSKSSPTLRKRVKKEEPSK